MKSTAIVLILILNVGCLAHGSHSHRISRSELLQQLQAEATRQQVYFHIWCTDENQYMAIATKGHELNIYTEDGAADYWSVFFFASADEAMAALILALQKPANHHPQHRREGKPRSDCPPPISGGPR